MTPAPTTRIRQRHVVIAGLVIVSALVFLRSRGGDTRAPDIGPPSSANGPDATPVTIDGAPAPRGGDPLDAIRWDTSPVDWARPVAWSASLASGAPSVTTEDGFVGSAECARCHAAVAERFAGHAMARTGLRAIDASRRRELAAAFDVSTVVKLGAFAYRPYRNGDRYFVEELIDGADGKRLHSWTQELTHTFTSGVFGLAFGFRSGAFIYQVPLDWYPGAHRWSLDPGYKRNARFSRPFASTCVQCHSEPPRHAVGSDDAVMDPLPGGVGCERCHGPGKKHVETLRKEDIVNPSNLSALRQLDVCAQCHLQGTAELLRAGRAIYGARAGEPLHAYRMNYVETEPAVDWFQLTSHSDRLTRSACFRGARGTSRELVCTTCHDPHKSSKAEPASHWRAGCVSCHAETACTAPMPDRRAVNDACASCHMRKDTPGDFRLQVADIELPITDHFIRRRVSPKTSRDAGATAIRLRSITSYAALVSDPASGPDLAALEAAALDLGGMGRDALPKLAAAASAHAESPDVYDALASRFESRVAAARSPDDRRRAADGMRRARAAVLRFRPDDVAALVDYARACFTHGADDAIADAHAALDRALEIMPQHPAALLEKSGALFRAGRLDEARPLLRRAADAGPDQVEAHVMLGVLARDAGALADAAARFEAARKREPRDGWLLDQLASLYERLGNAERHADLARIRAGLGTPGSLTSTRATRWLASSQR